MKRWLIALSALILSSCSADPVPNANIDQVVAAITAGATVIDVRTAEEMAEGMLPGAVPAPPLMPQCSNIAGGGRGTQPIAHAPHAATP